VFLVEIFIESMSIHAPGDHQQLAWQQADTVGPYVLDVANVHTGVRI